MNLRISPGSIRWRISSEEFSALVSDSRLESSTVLGAGIELGYRIVCAPLTGDRQLHLESSNDGAQLVLRLAVSRAALARLAAEAPSKDGISETQTTRDGEELKLALEIDLRREKRK